MEWYSKRHAVGNSEIIQFVMPAIESNMYAALHDEEALIIDPNLNELVLNDLLKYNVKSITVMLTHEHYDHICGLDMLRARYNVNAICTEAGANALKDSGKNLAKFWDALMMDKPEEVRINAKGLANYDYTTYADQTFQNSIDFVWHGHNVRMQSAPGHSKGGALIFFDNDCVFTGDNLVNGKGVICRLPGSCKRDFIEITQPVIESLPNDTLIFPGHGAPARKGELLAFINPFTVNTKECLKQ